MQFTYNPADTTSTTTLHLSDYQSTVRTIRDEYHTPIALVLSNPEREIESLQEKEQPQGERIALLLAAAPELAAALLECVSDPNCYAFAHDDFYAAKQRILAINRIAREALAKTIETAACPIGWDRITA